MSSLPKNLDNIKVENYEWVEHQGCVVVAEKFQWENPNSGKFLFSIKYVTFNVGKKVAQHIARLHNENLLKSKEALGQVSDLEYFRNKFYSNVKVDFKQSQPS